MGVAGGRESTFQLTVLSRDFTVTRRETPFREGVELEAYIDGEIVRVSDRQLGEREALAVLEQEIKRRLSGGG